MNGQPNDPRSIVPVCGDLDGKPLEGAIVVYHSSTHNVSAQGTTDKDGRFTLTTYKDNDGAATVLKKWL